MDWRPIIASYPFTEIPRVPWDHSDTLKSMTWYIPDVAKDHRTATSDARIIFQHDQSAYLLDHVIDGTPVLPGAEFILHALRQVPGNQLAEIALKMFLPLFVQEDRTIVEIHKDGDRIELRSEIGTHMSCVTPLFNRSWETIRSNWAETLATIDIGSFESVAPERLYRLMNRFCGLQFGERFQSIRALSVGDCQVESYIKVSETVRGPRAVSAIALDGCFQSLAILNGIDSDILLPLAVEYIYLTDEFFGVRNLRCFGQLTTIGANYIVGNLVILADDTIVGYVEGLKLVHASSGKSASLGLYTLSHPVAGINECPERDLDEETAVAVLTDLLEQESREKPLRILDLTGQMTEQLLQCFAQNGNLDPRIILIQTIADLQQGDYPSCFFGSRELSTIPRKSFDIVLCHSGESAGESATRYLLPHGIQLFVHKKDDATGSNSLDQDDESARELDDRKHPLFNFEVARLHLVGSYEEDLTGSQAVSATELRWCPCHRA